MNPPAAVSTVTPQELNQWIADGLPVIVIDTLTDDHFNAIHLPGARNACVFQVDFLDQVTAMVPDREAQIILYGASDASMEAVVAQEKLDRAGYRHVAVLAGGVRGWQAAGLAVVGDASSPPAPTHRLSLADGAYRVDIDRSLIEWAGRNPNTKHDGAIGLASGTITVRDGRPTGSFTIDMTRIENRSLAGDDLQPVLIDHLMSDDFFFTALFPTATFTIRDGRPRGDAHLSAPNIDIQGELTLRGVNAGLDFAATAVQAPDGTITARAQFDMDRTRWQIIYGSARFFEHLGMHLVFDHISIDVKIVAVKTG